jgi:hypothetical protein
MTAQSAEIIHFLLQSRSSLKLEPDSHSCNRTAIPCSHSINNRHEATCRLLGSLNAHLLDVYGLDGDNKRELTIGQIELRKLDLNDQPLSAKVHRLQKLRVSN